MIPNFRIIPLGDSAITIDFGNVIDETTNQYVIILFHYWQERKLPGIKDIIPAYSSLSIVYDIGLVKNECKVDDVYSFLKDELENSVEKIEWKKPFRPVRKEIPVCYEESFAPDLRNLGERKNLSAKEIIKLHCGRIYRVYMVGFLPGFAYMGKVDKRLAMPRKETPSPLVTKGSVGITGEQTGIYPFDSPGGWHIIGRTPLRMFEARKKNPVFLNTGDEVQFVQITLKEFQQLSNEVT